MKECTEGPHSLLFTKEYKGNLEGEFINLSEVTWGIFPCTNEYDVVIII